MEGLVSIRNKEIKNGYITKFSLVALWIINLYRKRNSRAPVDRLVVEENTA